VPEHQARARGQSPAPALRQAEVGIAVSTAADVAKASASVVLTAEGLTSIVQLVRSGRVVYQRVLTWIVNLGWRAFRLGEDLPAAQTFSFQALLYSALFSILSVRERDHFWRSAPSRVLLAALAFAGVAGALLRIVDLPGLRSIPPVQTLAVVGAALVASLGVIDLVKTALIRRGGLAIRYAPAPGAGGRASPAPPPHRRSG